MVTIDIVKKAMENNALTELFNKLDKSDSLKALGILVILGVSIYTIDAIKKIVEDKVYN